MYWKILRFVIGVLLIPVSIAATRTVLLLVRAIQPHSASAVPPEAWGLIGGFVIWLILFFTVPRPVRTYVLAHELTHALWGFLMGAEVSGLKVSKEKGSVNVSKNNVVITLAPYFFPLYTMLVLAVYYVLSLFFEVQKYDPWWLGLVGFTWGFHFTFTITTLLQKQTDMQQYGYLFSYTLIYCLNVLGIGFWIVAVSAVTLKQMMKVFGSSTVHVWHLCRRSVELVVDLWR
jgi:hypothetical protein